ncbi:LysM peptidoglycan-binding domain-containing protein, partial [Brevibacterium senegalense]|uniref:LysM peptidoglycan-binding domain-containing protein n=1 Tax=Brevibacterium senegalense TaxID=1033736 RepID=UPI00036C6AA0
APRAARTALTAAVGGTLTAAVLAGPALASSPSPAWPLTPAESAPAEPTPAETHRDDSTGAPDPRWPLVEETAAPGADGSSTDGSARDALDHASGSGDQDAPADHHVVVAGDSLWRISADRLPGAAPAEIAAGVQELKDANRDVIGMDANLILPGQRLVLP